MRLAHRDLALLVVLIAFAALAVIVYGVGTSHGRGLRCTYGPDTAHHRCATAPR